MLLHRRHLQRLFGRVVQLVDDVAQASLPAPTSRPRNSNSAAGYPASATVGTSGNSGARLGVLTASAVSLPVVSIEAAAASGMK